MMKIIALNEETVNSKNEIELANTVTKEAQEQIAFNEYNRALQLIINGEKEEALNVLKDLLDTELLDNVEKPLVKDGRSRPLLSLKYSCFKNIASVQEELKNYHEALQSYWEAANLDDSDVLLWYRIGNVAIETCNLETACLAFKQGLQRNSHHWPSLDKMITVLYAIPDYMTCLLYISIAFERDSSYIKGLAFREKILKNNPLLIHSYKLYNSNWDLDPPLDIEYNRTLGDSLIEEASELSKKWIEFKTEPNANKSLSDLTLLNSLTEFSWLELGKGLIKTYKYMFNNNLHFIRPIVLSISESFGSVRCDDDEDMDKKLDSRSPNNDKFSIMNNLQGDRSFNISNNQNSDIIELDDKNKCFPSDVEEDADRTDVNKDFSKEFDENNSNNSEIKEDDNSSNLKYCEKSSNVKDEYKVDNDDSEKSNVKVNEKLSANDGNNKFNLKEKSQKVKKRRRSSLCILKQWAWSSNNANRVSRSRNTNNRKDYERDGVVLEETLKRIFPPTLLPDNTRFVKDDYLKNEDSMDTMDLYYLSINKENNNFAEDTKSTESSKPASPADVDQLKYFGTEQENIDVKQFIDEHSSKSNIILIITKFIEILCTKWNYEWSDELPEIYVDLYTYLREHVPHFSPFCDDIEDCSLKVDEEATLLYCEFYLDKWLSSKPCTLPGPSSSKFGIGISSNDLGDLLFCTYFNKTHNEENMSFLLRLLWLKANIFLYQGDVDISLRTLELLLDYMQQLQNKTNRIFLKLTNCKYNSFIDVKSVEKMITFIQRSKQICEIRRLHEQKKFEELSIILKDTFNFSKQTNQFLLSNEAPIDRTEHLKILLDSLWHLKQYEDCFMWGEVCLNECWQNYLNAICLTEEERNKWTTLILYCFEKLHACVDEVSTFIIKYLPVARRSRFVQNLVQIVCHQLDVVDNTPKMPIESVLPWILLHFVLQYVEDKQRAKRIQSSKNKSGNSLNVESDEDEEDIPASITILLKAHEFLGRHGWCCVNEGHLLIYIMKLVIPKLHFPLYYSIKLKLKLPLEQIIYCLYGHPAKANNAGRPRPKYVEHVKDHLTLNWDMCELVFELFKPESLPNFDSNRIYSINADTVNLFKRMCGIIPQDSNPTFIEKEMNGYLLGNVKNTPSIKTPLPDSISYIFYYIADHYFKATLNNSWARAIKYYTLDLCVHPHEANSWAGLAMATSTLMETWLNNFEPNISEEDYLSKAKKAERSYQNAIKLEPDHLTIMTEFGNFLYTVHSYCSRLLKQESDSLNMERFGILEARKEQMLDEAKNCFEKALKIYDETQGIGEPQDERWLYHYMLAKVAEKKNEDPPLFLRHYTKASQLLFENGAQYPKRINHKNPQYLSVEALEVYYRIHASILKYLEQHEGKPIKKSLAAVFERSLKYCMQAPFMVYNSIFVNVSDYKVNNADVTLTEVKSLNNMQECEINKTTSDKCDSRKRSHNEPGEENDTKRIKSASTSVSHLQVMHDVVAVIDDIITKVCNSARTVQTPRSDDKVESKSSISSTTNVKVESDRIKVKDFANISNKQDSTLKLKKEQSSQENDFKKEQILKSSKIEEKKKVIKEGVLSRRGSQESTTTTHTSTSETNNSTSSSSDESSSSEDTSGSSDSTDSESDSNESDTENHDITVIKEGKNKTKENASEEEINKLIEYCIAGLEQCTLRFPEHYKSTYRLASFYSSSKISKNLSKCKQLLLGTYECQYFPKETINGLFFEKRTANFFNGIWRIPNNEIDRPGSFASHMSRCIILLMQVLKEAGDSRMLTEISIQLKKTPDTDKKYLRDAERKQLSCQALTMCLQCLRYRIQALDSKKGSANFQEERTKLLLDIFHTHEIIKGNPDYTSEIPKTKKLLEDAYIVHVPPIGIQGNTFDLAKDFVRSVRRAQKTGTPSISETFDPNRTMGTSNITLPTENVNTNYSTNMNASIANPAALVQNRKSHKVSRPRGRPPGVNKFSPAPSNDSLFSQSQNMAKNFSDCGNSLLTSLIDPVLAYNYLTQFEAYQDYLQRCQNSLSGFNPNLNKSIPNNIPNIQPVNKPVSTDGCLNIANERPDISITPVTDNASQKKSKAPKMPTNPLQNDPTSMFMQLSKSVQITPTSHFPLPKQNQKRSQPTTGRYTNLIPSTMTKDSGLSVNRVPFPQAEKNATETVGSAQGITQGITQPNISLQHKLLSKKQYQQPYPSTDQLNLLKRQKLYKSNVPTSSHKSQLDTASINRVNFPLPDKTVTEAIANSRISNPYADLNVTPLSVKSFASTKYNKTLITPVKNTIPKLPSADVSLKPSQSTAKVNAPSVFSQLQQHSHLEIIPQTNYVKSNVDKTSFFGKSTVIQSLPKSTSIGMQNLPKSTPAMIQSLPKTGSSTVQNLPKSAPLVVQNLPKSPSAVVQSLPKSASSVVPNLPKSTSSVVQSLPKSTSSVVQSLPKPVNISSNDSVSIYELPRRNVNINLSTTPQVPKRDKSEKNDVEIITLDD